jgi:transposase
MGFAADERHIEVEVAWQCAQQLRSIYHQPDHAHGRRIAEKVLASFPSCPIPEIARLGRTLNQWRDAFLGYFTTNGANNGGTEAICEYRGGWSGTGWQGGVGRVARV